MMRELKVLSALRDLSTLWTAAAQIPMMRELKATVVEYDVDVIWWLQPKSL